MRGGDWRDTIATGVNISLLLHILLSLFLLGHDIAGALSEDGLILLRFKSAISDAGNSLGDWLESDTDPCGWTGVTCTSESSVTGLDLSSKNLMGGVQPTLCQLPFLTSLQLQDNLFSGSLPWGISNCSKLEYLNLGANNFTGPIPASLSELLALRYLNITLNTFEGGIPGAFGSLLEMQGLDLVACGVNGSVPAELGNLVKMNNLSLSWNAFSPGYLPSTFENLQQLHYFECAGCKLRGAIPSWLGNLSELEYLDLSNNEFSESIPPSLMRLQNLRWLELYKNKLTGPIPQQIRNLTSLTDLDLSDNYLSGPIPDEIGRIEPLELLHLQNNSFVGSIPPSLVLLQNLYDLKLYMNRLTGTIPPTLGSNSTLLQFDVSSNSLHGPIPSTLCSRGELWRLILFNNSFSGSLPESYGHCLSLIRIRIFNNMFTGPIPSGLWGLPILSLLEIHDNLFEGSVLPNIGNASSLTSLNLYRNRFSGSLPKEIGRLSCLDHLSAYQNNFSGEIPPEIGNLGSSLTNLYLDENHFSGPIPARMSNLSNLVYLSLAMNQLSGSIPTDIGKLKHLIYLNLSRNALGGDISEAMEHLKLSEFIYFDCSYNNFSGTIASTTSSNLFPSGFVGNPNVCITGSTLSSNMCAALHENMTRPSYPHKLTRILTTFLIGGVMATSLTVAVMVVLTMCFFCKRRNGLEHSFSNNEQLSPWSMTSFHSMVVSYKEIMECMDEDNVIGSGGGGKVYRATLRSGQDVAIKKLWGAVKGGSTLHDHGFKAEMETLGSIRHRNIVKLLCSCSSIDSNFLVYEYMPNGSLGDLLHSAKGGKLLDWSMRHRIAIGAAQGLAYLHHDCVPQILHRDVKSNNILLDVAYEAHIADFGLAKSLEEVSMSAIAGSYGYIAPEYTYTLQVNEKSDVYSFGVVLMELVTGRRPIDPEFGDGNDIVKWVNVKLQSKMGFCEVLDVRVAGNEQYLVLMLKVALFCTQILPRKRPSMRKVVEMLLQINPPQKLGKGGAESLPFDPNEHDVKVQEAREHDSESFEEEITPRAQAYLCKRAQ